MSSGSASTRSPGDAQFAFLLADVLRLLRADYAQRVRGLSLTPALHRLMFHLARNPGCRQVELAEWMEITPVTVGRMVDRLERQKLVRRERQPGDRRAARVTLDEGAQDMMKQLTTLGRQSRERALHGLARRERIELVHALAKIRENLVPRADTSPPTRGRRGR